MQISKSFPHELISPDRMLLNQDRQLRQQMLDIWAELLDMRYDSELLKKLVMRYASAEKRIRKLHSQLSEDVAAAAAIQQTLLPSILPESDRMQAAWKFQPCDAVGGDIIGLTALDENRWGCYVLDVAGHGPRAAMITISVAQFLKPSSAIDMFSPPKVMDALEEEFPFTRFGSFFTILYGVLDLRKQMFSFCNAGHPYPMLARPGADPEMIAGHDAMLGLGIKEPRNEMRADISDGGRLLLYTDGLTECVAPDGSFYGEERLMRSLAANLDQSAAVAADAVFDAARAFAAGTSYKDDFTMLLLQSSDQRA
ncbi:MAG: hypothetical protein CVV42_04845 [Candidatus Riflebacteria bacterium HGW-Riflebacteria-2]|jgi:sigma-B regulation protein RsbU (phosphoserine phosphatase)|nr:MAG: hypothetical protein CVV42_04845 [Candidatus Riflebacteria bacterium HGW-Riflebacteria-2]